MIKWVACLGQQLVPGLDTLVQQNLLPRNPRQRSRLIVVNKQNTQSYLHSTKHHKQCKLNSYKKLLPYLKITTFGVWQILNSHLCVIKINRQKLAITRVRSRFNLCCSEKCALSGATSTSQLGARKIGFSLV